MFESTEEESARKVDNRRVDPVTGNVYNLEINPPSDEKVVDRLIQLKEDHGSVIRNKYTKFKQEAVVLEEAFKDVLIPVNSNRSVEEINSHMADALANPL